ncbi:MAG: hypothetical protein JNJ58_10265 [Chitinophagaceae bacterium]|nr:hypothetical protein [Chitinophagaceae bacterium]
MLGLSNYINQIPKAWREAITDRTFVWKILLTPGLFFIYSAITQRLGNYIEMRKGVVLEDKLLYLFPSYDFSFYIFILLYSSLTLVILTHLHKPQIILRIIEMHFLVAVVRQACILLVALDPPVGIIVLRDVFLENTVYPRHSPLTKDLFFSGHVASIWLYFLCADHKHIRLVLAISTLLMAFMILCMKVHYTYDVYGAIIFTTVLYMAPSWFRSYIYSGEMARSRKNNF